MPFDPNKGGHVRHLFYDVLCLPAATKKDGKESADQKQLELLKVLMNKGEREKAEPYLDAFLENRAASKIISTYTDTLINWCVGERIHPAFLQVNAASGRVASRDPNGQNIPRAEDYEALDPRSGFVADPGYLFVVYDYAAMEFKIASALSRDPFLVRAANDTSLDVHTNTARACFNIPETERVEKTDQRRQAAKTITYAVLYGASGYALTKQLPGISVWVGEALIDKFYRAYPGLRTWIETVHAEIMSKGYVETLYGRRRWADKKLLTSNREKDWAGELRKLTNTLVQGLGADIMKIAMKVADTRLQEKKMDAAIVMQAHDELVVLAREDQAQEVASIVGRAMIHKVYDVTLPVEGRIVRTLSKHEDTLLPVPSLN
jgi:DNA polymerase-1